MTTAVVNPYLDGNFAPARSEITASRLLVLGELPADLCGVFVRNGPNPSSSEGVTTGLMGMACYMGCI